MKSGRAKSAPSFGTALGNIALVLHLVPDQAEAVRGGMPSRLFFTVDKRLLSYESEQKQSLLASGDSLENGQVRGQACSLAMKVWLKLHACRHCADDSIFCMEVDNPVPYCLRLPSKGLSQSLFLSTHYEQAVIAALWYYRFLRKVFSSFFFHT